MSLQVENLEHNMAKLTITVSAEEVEKALQAAYLKQRSKISLPGFRKGKVPRQMIEKMYGPEVFYDEAANHMISEAYGKAYDECELEIASQPTIDVVQLEKGKDFIFTAEVAVKPEVKLGEYKGLKVDKVSTRVMQKEVDEEIEKERERNARTVEVTDRAVQDKDIVTLDFEGFVDGVAFEGGKGENYPLTIGSGAFIPGFEEQLIGAEIDKEVEVNVTFPKEYHSEELAGKDATFKCTVHTIKAKELPELDDEFASEVSEFDTLDELKADIKAKIKEQKENEGKQKKEDQAVEKAVANATMEIPEAMIDEQVRQMVNEFAQNMQYQGISFEHVPSGIDTMTVYVHQDEFEEKEQQVIAGIHRLVQPDFVEMESDLALIAVVGRGMKSTRGTAGRIFSALAHANVNVKMIDQGSSELNIIIGVENRDFENAVKAIYDIFVLTQM